MRKSFLIFAGAMLVIVIVMVCLLGNDKEEHEIIETGQQTEETSSSTEKATQKSTEKSTQTSTSSATEEVLTVYTDFEDEEFASDDGVAKNSNTNEQIIDFKYLSEAQNTSSSAVSASYDDILTCYIKDCADPNSEVTHYIIDLKLGKLYFASKPSRWYNIDDYSDELDLTDDEIWDIIDAIANAGTQGWSASDTGSDKGCDRFSNITLEYANGAIEKHSVACLGCISLEGFNSIADTVAKIAKGYTCEKCGETHVEGESCEDSEENEGSEAQAEGDGEAGHHHHHYYHHTVYTYECYCYE